MNERDNETLKLKPRNSAAVGVVWALIVGLASLGSWFIWDQAFQRFDGRCVGPVCIQSDATTEGNSDIEH